jgi:two-component system response regulator YesN
MLVVDDESELTGFVRDALEGEFDVETAQSTAEADMYLGLRAFDVVLADYMMPGETGLEFLMRSREHFPKMKRILMTGYLNPDLISRAQNLAELSSYLIKPVNLRQLRTAVLGALTS